MIMVKVNEQLDKLWTGNLPGDTKEKARQMRVGLIEHERLAGVKTPGVHQMDNSVDAGK